MAVYDPLARFYDLEYEGFEDDLPLYLELARRTGSPVLDVGCGTGRVTFALARAGFQVTGIDESEAMLARAVSKIDTDRTLGARVKLVQATAAHCAAGTRYRLAVMALNSFGHLLTTSDQLEALLNLRRCLAPESILVIDMANPDPLGLGQSDGLLVLHWEKQDPTTGGWVQKWLTHRTDRACQMQYYTMIYDTTGVDGVVSRCSIPVPFRYTFRYEAELLLERAGFVVENLYGSYQLDAYDSDRERMIFVAIPAGKPTARIDSFGGG